MLMSSCNDAVSGTLLELEVAAVRFAVVAIFLYTAGFCNGPVLCTEVNIDQYFAPCT